MSESTTTTYLCSQRSSACVAAITGMTPLATLLSIDPFTDDCNRLLIHACGVPSLNRGKVGLARLITGAAYPAVAFQEIGSGGKRIGFGVEIHAAIAFAVRAVEQDVLGQKLRLPDLAVHGAARRRAERAAIDERQGSIKLLGE